MWSSLQVHVLRSWVICAYCKNCFPIIWTNLVYPIFRCYTYIHLLIKVRNIYLSTILAFRGRWLWFFFLSWKILLTWKEQSFFFKFDQIFLFKNYRLRLYIFFVSFQVIVANPQLIMLRLLSTPHPYGDSHDLQGIPFFI